MKNLNTKAIILGHKNIGEANKIISLYTEEVGKLRVIAKSARKITSKFTGHLETLNFCQVQLYFGPRNIILQEITTIKNFKKIRENVEKITTAIQIAEFTNKMIYENQKIDGLFSLLEKTLKQLIISTKPLLTGQSYMIKIMDQMGLIPDFKNIHSDIDLKYLKFFHFLKTQPVHTIENIYIEESEAQTIKTLLDQFTQVNLP